MTDSTPHAGRGVVFGPTLERDGTTVVPVAASSSHTARAGDRAAGSPATAEMAGGRPLGALEVRDGRVRWRPVVDVTRVVTTAEVVLGAVAVASRLARRPSPTVARVTMGPGGWVSMKGGAMAVRPARRIWRRAPLPAPTRRPWWARLLAATALERLVG
ncbi:hypothetical protein GCM10027451_51890 [Geodermatophilus aquaeductus]|uniref:Uncharacterized protein n=1 Tax=Geodermatophilus aquaeductus TaxID=1564161 RepID=A0A521FV77_9ACTN|nr:hypothetical protein [Geodermatophilus aquaeductus]SMP00083.1 hypothetical protein SAMN06273567_12321 [Geodermatophilus aquaeductus]